MTSPTVFISYSHKDETWKDRLVTHLGVLQQEGILDEWDDRRIGAGGNWYQKIEEAIAKASVAVLLVSADFLTSKFILSKEIPDLLERRDKEGLRIFPVIIKPCAWKHVKWLARMNLRPKDGRPIQGGSEFQVETDLTAIADEVAAIIESVPPETPLETSPTTTPEKISVAEPVHNRPDDLKASIQETLELIKEYEDKRRRSSDPKEQRRYEREIADLRKLLEGYEAELAESRKVYEKEKMPPAKTTVPIQNDGSQLHQMDTKLNTLLDGQKKIQDTLINLRETVLARFDANEQTIIATIVDRLDREQLINTQAVLDSIATRQFAENELKETLVAVRDTLNEIRQTESFLSDSHLTTEIEDLSDVVDAPELDVSHKLKITVPIIPFILSYEGEIALKSGLNLESAWQRLLSKVRR